MLKQSFLAPVVALFVAAAVTAQQPNTGFAALNIDGPASAAVTAPAVVPVFTDSQICLNIKAFPAGGSPVVVLFATSFAANGSLSFNAFNGFGFQIDIPDQGPSGYDDQTFVNGYVQPGSLSYADALGDLIIPVTIPACTVFNNVPVCITQSTFEVGTQALVVDFTNGPFNIRSTGAGRATFQNTFQQWMIGNDSFATYTFFGGFQFNFYGTNYTQARVSENGYIAFTTNTGLLTGFPDPQVQNIRTGPPRIMSFYNDLIAAPSSFNPRIYASQFVVPGSGGCGAPSVTKVKFVHERLQEFGNATGPHGGEIIITSEGDIAVFVAPYNGLPSINTAVGITPGNGGPQVTGFGRDLSVDSLSGPTVLIAGDHGYELFNHGISPATNPIDLIGFGATAGLFNGVGPGILFQQSNTNLTQYTIF